VDVNEEGEYVVENSDGRDSMDGFDAKLFHLQLQHPDGRWLDTGDVEIMDAYRR
jgi:hypothetical protein